MPLTRLADSARLALDTLLGKPGKGIPTSGVNIMEHRFIERLAGAERGEYKRDPHRVYLDAQRAAGVCMIDQYIPENPLTMEVHGYEGKEKGATTGAEKIILDGIHIDSPEAVVEHMERFVFPALQDAVDSWSKEKEDTRVREIIAGERAVQKEFGLEILKCPYAVVSFPCFRYGMYGYANYFMAYALYPGVMEKDFSMQADFAVLTNHAAARAYREGDLPPFLRLDHDMADSRGMLVDIDSLDRLWLPCFARALAPMLETDVRMIWHCDGNLMDMVPRLLDVGLHGFQGFQYEDGMDYEALCKRKTRDGDDLLILAGASVTRTLPMGTPADVKRELTWLVDHGPKTGLFLGCSSSLTPGVPWANVETLVEGLKHYRTHGRE